MQFAQALERLTIAANCGTRGLHPTNAIVKRADLQELLHAFYNADDYRRQNEKPRL